jgi:hypothetical protein
MMLASGNGGWRYKHYALKERYSIKQNHADQDESLFLRYIHLPTLYSTQVYGDMDAK